MGHKKKPTCISAKQKKNLKAAREKLRLIRSGSQTTAANENIVRQRWAQYCKENKVKGIDGGSFAEALATPSGIPTESQLRWAQYYKENKFNGIYGSSSAKALATPSRMATELQLQNSGCKSPPKTEGNETNENEKTIEEIQVGTDYKEYFKEICRLCMCILNKNEFESIKRSKKSEYVKKIFLCCDIEIANDCLPQCICTTCIRLLEKSYKFRLKCLEYNEKILKIYHDAQNNIRPELPFHFTESRLTETDVDIKPEIAIVKTESVDVLEGDFEPREENIIVCADGLELLSIASIKQEELILENNDYFNGDFSGDVDNKDDDVVIENEEVQVYTIDSDNDYCSDEDTEFSCIRCPYVCTSLKEFKLHKVSHHKEINQKHSVATPLFCQAEGCQLEFSSFSARRAHTIESHSGESFSGYYDICPFCTRTMPLSYNKPNTKNLALHIKYSHTNETQVCDKCGYRSKNPQLLREHKQRSHQAVARIPCPDCGKLIVKYHLADHLRNLHKNNRKGFICHFCGKKFSDNYNLRSHMRTHTGDLPFKCPDCEKAFSHNVSMKTHRLKVHHIDMFKKKEKTEK